jgi:hypothetical protein
MAMNTVEYVTIYFSPTSRSRPVIEWCEKNIGEIGTDWDFTFNAGSSVGGYNAIFEFARSKDASYFTLKWT